MAPNHHSAIVDAYLALVKSCRAILETPGTKAETSLYTPFDTFFRSATSVLAPIKELDFIAQAGAESIGIPDFRVNEGKELFGWVEVKAVVGKPLAELTGHDADQRSRFVDGLHNLILTNGWEWELYQDGRRVGSKIAMGVSNPFAPDTLLTEPSAEAVDALINLLSSFLAARLAPYTSAASAVTALATRAKALKSGLIELKEGNASPSLVQLKRDFRELVFKNGQPFTWDRFVDSYVQIAAFGALLWRLESGTQISLDLQVGLKQGAHPLLYRCLVILWSPESHPEILKALLEELCRTINLTTRGRDGGAPPRPHRDPGSRTARAGRGRQRAPQRGWVSLVFVSP